MPVSPISVISRRLPIYTSVRIYAFVNVVRIHRCLADPTRLRIAHLLLGGPLCVCHLQKVLGAPQVKVSRHLAYLRRNGMVAAERCGQWMIYDFPGNAPPAFDIQIDALRRAAAREPLLRRDRARLVDLKKRLGKECPECVRTPSKRKGEKP